MVVEAEKGNRLMAGYLRQKYVKNFCISQLKRKQSNSPTWNEKGILPEREENKDW